MRKLLLAISLAALFSCGADDAQITNGVEPYSITVLNDPDDDDLTIVPPPSVINTLLLASTHHYSPDYIQCVSTVVEPCIGSAMSAEYFLQTLKIHPEKTEPFSVTPNATIDDLGNALIVGEGTDQSLYIFRLSVGEEVESVSLQLGRNSADIYSTYNSTTSDTNVKVSPSADYPAPVVNLGAVNYRCQVYNSNQCTLKVVTQHYSSEFYKNYSAYVVTKTSNSGPYKTSSRLIDLSSSYYEVLPITINLDSFVAASEYINNPIELRLVVTDEVLNTRDSYKSLHDFPGVAYVSPPLEIGVEDSE